MLKCRIGDTRGLHHFIHKGKHQLLLRRKVVAFSPTLLERAYLLIAHSGGFGKSHVLYPGILCLDTVSNAQNGEFAQFWIEFELF